MGKESLEVLARMTDTTIEVKDVVSQYVLLTYDIPHNEAGDKIRREFLAEAKAIGAMRFTDSCYFMPFTPAAEMLALKLARSKGAEVVVWVSNPAEAAAAKEVTNTYDESLKPILQEIGERLDRIWENQTHNRRKLALRMLAKTERMLDQAESAIDRRGSQTLKVWVTALQQRFNQVQNI